MVSFADLASLVRVPTADEKIFKDECPFHFETPESENGVYICLKNFIPIGSKMLRLYHENTGCRAFLRYKIEKYSRKSDMATEQPTKLAIGVPGGFDFPEGRYTVTEHWSLVRLPEGDFVNIPNPLPQQSPNNSHLNGLNLPNQLADCIAAVQRAESALIAEERAREMTAWEDDNVCVISQHAMNLVQINNGIRVPPSGWKCAKCDLKENLWLNLTDGTILCGRKFWNNFGGNNHALEHYEVTKYPLVVKLGTITPKGGEVYSYEEDSMVTDPKLAEHLAHFGIDIMRMQKTDKTMAEVEISANERLSEWLTLQEANSTLVPRYGPGMTGLRNLGNTCYMNVIFQVLFAIPPYRWYFSDRLSDWSAQAFRQFSCQRESINLIDNVGLQFAKLGHGLCSGDHSWLVPQNCDQITQNPLPPLPGIRPLLLRRLMGLHSKTFATCSQQDASEFYNFLLDLLAKHTNLGSPLTVLNSHKQPRQVVSPNFPLQFIVEDRLQCGLTGKVHYTTNTQHMLCIPVPMEAVNNKVEVEMYEKRRLEAEAKGLKLSLEEVVRPHVSFSDCLSAWLAEERIDGFKTPASTPPGAKTYAIRSNRLANFPDYICIEMGRFTVGKDWVPIKLDVELEFPFDKSCNSDHLNIQIDLSSLQVCTHNRGNEQLMNNQPNEADQPNRINMEIVNSLTQMGFTLEACKKACRNTENRDLESATDWLMEHLDDPTLNDPDTTLEQGDSSLFVVDNNALELMMSMGFGKDQSHAALKHFKNDVEAATDFALSNPDALNELLVNQTKSVTTTNQQAGANVAVGQTDPSTLTNGKPIYELIAFVSHMGKLPTVGHYVVHIKRSSLAKSFVNDSLINNHPSDDDDEWIIFNDDKVAKSADPPHRHGYLYFFRRLDAPSD